MTNKQWQFNFGPIARTDAGTRPDGRPIHDTFNLASLPLHVMLDALMAATNRDEFVAWLWHDLFKPAFYWVSQGPKRFSWNHVPGYVGSPFESAEGKFAATINIPIGLVSTHHARNPQLIVREGEVMADQSDQLNLGPASVYIQLTLAVEPALPTALVRAVIAESFVEAATKSVAVALSQTLASKTPNFSRVRFVFETQQRIGFSTPPTGTEIWNRVGQHYDVRVQADELVMRHFTPINTTEPFESEFVVDLTGVAPSPEQLLENLFGLAELLIVYQDDRTIIMTVPQPQIYALNIATLKSETLSLARNKLNSLDVLTTSQNPDLLETVFDSQVEIREVPDRGVRPRSLDKVIANPSEQLGQAATRGRRCRICGSAFDSKLPQKTDWPGHDFTDPEHLGFGSDICPLCRIYAVNSHKSRTPEEKNRGITGDRKALRGSFALILPSSHFDVQDEDCRLVEKPPLDVGGRFDLATVPLHRVTVTQQEYALFNQMSRRVIAGLWLKIESTAALPLPYLGGILLTHREASQVRKVLPAMRALFAPVTLKAYPFDVKVTPGVEIALDVVLTDFKQHHTKHTYLKSRASIVPIHPDSRLSMLADNKLQIELNRDWFKAYDRLAAFTAGMSAGQRKEWLKRVAGGSDVVTAYYESAETSLRSKRKTAKTAEQMAFAFAGSFWITRFGDDPSQGWAAYEDELKNIREILGRYPMFPQLFSALTERKEKEDDNSNAADTSQKAGASADRGAGRRGEAGTTKRTRARRQTGG